MKNKEENKKNSIVKTAVVYFVTAFLTLFGKKQSDALISAPTTPVQASESEKTITNKDNLNIIPPVTPTPTPVITESPFTKYDLTDEQLTALAVVAYSEAGTPRGAASVATIMSNRLQHRFNGEYNGKTGGEALYEMVKCEPWFRDVEDYMDSGHLADWCDDGRSLGHREKTAVYNALNGIGTVPLYIDEFDSWDDKDYTAYDKFGNDITNNRDLYIPGETIIKNNYASSYTFEGWIDPNNKNSDPMGCSKSINKVKYTNFHYKYSSTLEEAKCESHGPGYVIASIEYYHNTSDKEQSTNKKEIPTPKTEGPQNIFDKDDR